MSGRLLYLSGAPRVSTSVDSSTPGPRSHILGVLEGFQDLGWSQRRVIVGDHMPARLRGHGTSAVGGGGAGVARDLMRLAIASASRAAARRALLAYHPDLVYERFGTLSALGPSAVRHGDIPYVLESNGLFYEEAAADRSNLTFVRKARDHELGAYRRADVVVAVTESLRQRLLEAEPVLADKCIVIPNGVDADVLAAGRRASLPPPATPAIGWIGTMVPWHGLEVLLEALSAAQSNGHSVPAHLIGTGPQQEYLEKMARKLGLSEVRFYGQLPRRQGLQVLGQHATHGYLGHKRLSGQVMYHSPLKMYEYAALGLDMVASETLAPHTGPWRARLFEEREELIDLLCSLQIPSDQARDAQRRLVAEKHTWTARVQVLLDELRRRRLVA